MASPVGKETSESHPKQKRAWYLNCSNSAILNDCISIWRTYCTAGGSVRTDYTAYCGLYCGCETDNNCIRCDKTANMTEAETVPAETDAEKREETSD